MNSSIVGRVGLFLLLAIINVSRATVITSDTSITSDNLSLEGADIVITNCTVTLDGAHGFNSLQILNGGSLTHSPYTNTTQTITNMVTGEAQILSSTNAPTLNNINVDASTIVVTDQSATTTYTNGVDYLVTIAGQYTQLSFSTTNSSSIPDGATVLVSYKWTNTTTIAPGFNLIISNDTYIATGGMINVSGKGYLGGSGSGAGSSRSTSVPYTFTAGAGGSHGGYGGMSTSGAAGGIAYGSLTNSSEAGSGGGMGSSSGASGGGVAQLTIDGTMQLDGQILATGFAATNAHAGGGAGGSVFISAQTISGSGTISANGGSGELPDGGGGGGGRIAIYFATNNFTGTISAFGGSGAKYGGAGTVFMQAADALAGQLTIDNSGHRGTNTPFGQVAISNLTVTGGAGAQFSSGILTISNLLLGANSSIDSGTGLSLQISVRGDAMIQSNGIVSADFKSMSSGSASTFCATGNSGTGGSHAGFGGAGICGRNGGTSILGLITQPNSAGTAGGAAGGSAPPGGGILRVMVVGTLSLAGKISADGASGAGTVGAGGGAGGSVWITVGMFSGNGAISANGGAANNALGGGGSGGRIAVYFVTNSFTGSIKAAGGAAVNGGAAGTVYLQQNYSVTGSLSVDNGGINGAVTPLSALAQSDLIISGGAVVSNTLSTSFSLGNLFVGSNSWFQFGSVYPALTASNAVIEAGGGIVANGVSSSGSGAGQSANQTGGGGANAGYGGDSASLAAGGTYFSSSATAPLSPGGSGGIGYTGSGAKGGGAIKLIVNQTLHLDGIISANGDAGTNLNSGGAAGGSLWITARTIFGSGTLSADGGNGNNLGGGGSGGRIAVLFDTNLFVGDIHAFGGTGGNNGSAGSIYLNRNGLTTGGKFILDNNGRIARGNPSSPNGLPSQPFDLIITGGAALTNNSSSSLAFDNLVVGSNSIFFICYSSSATLVVNTNATIFTGGKIVGDGFGIRTSPNGSYGGGGGYGGAGGASSIGGSSGAAAYQDSILRPTGAGAYGSSYTSSGSKGGGALKITVYGTFVLDGKISSDGLTSTNAGGAGSGGAIWIAARTISGSGALSVNGGSALSSMGGGGGGRIALWSDTNNFMGTFSACGGSGANYGGAGTIYLNPNFSAVIAYPRIAVDNGGNAGAITPLWSEISTMNLVVTGGAVVSSSIPSMAMGTLLVGSNSTMVLSYSQQTLTATNATIERGGKINSDGISGSTLRAGQSVSSSGGGGGYGGAGGASLNNALGGASYSDSLSYPSMVGSIGGYGLNGNGGPGGGAFHLTFPGTLQLDGTISANGATGPGFNSGGGSGGGILIQAGTISGNGVIAANGGAANSFGGGGGGGRVALWFNTNAFTGNLMARGGGGANYGGAGTVYTTSSFYGYGNSSAVIIDNGGAHGTNTVFSSTVSGDLLITNGATASLSSSAMTWKNLTIASNAILNLAVPANSMSINIFGKLLIQRGGAILLDGQGYAANNGTGRGYYAPSGNSYACSGGGHGGMGSSGNSAAAGGVDFDDIANPTLPGSGGGVYTGGGSSGGGAVRLTVTGLATVDGVISANGLDATTPGGGGGAGGTVWLTAGGISGSGKISADGGAGDPFSGGGGAGGRIAFLPLATGPGTFITNGFTGTISARGGAGFAMAGGAGTIYLQTNYPGAPLLLLDNGSQPGTNTPLTSLSQTVALAIRNGAAGNSTVPLTLQTLSVSNATFNVINPLTALDLTVLGDASIESGSSICADTAGYSSAHGPGVGAVDSSSSGGGGGYGGFGGVSSSGAGGGATYGSSNQPIDFGSVGGLFPVLPNFSQGGGAIRLAVHGTLSINGSVSANGNDGVIDGAGGGSGGSIWIDATTLSGSGVLSANGGNGESFQGGGGGGGRIAVYLATNSFGGNAFTSGGDGASPGQDGTIYWQTNLVISGGVFDTNGAPLADITLQPDGFAAITTDTNGSYSITVPPFWSGNIAASSGGFFYVPNSRTYANLQTNALAQNFMTASSAMDFDFAKVQFNTGTNVDLQWHGYGGVQYQPLYSTNLVDWLPYGSAMSGTNGPMTLTAPAAAPQMYFRLSVTY